MDYLVPFAFMLGILCIPVGMILIAFKVNQKPKVITYEYRLEELTQQLKNLNEWMTWEDAENEAKFYLSIAKVQYPREKDLK